MSHSRSGSEPGNEVIRVKVPNCVARIVRSTGLLLLVTVAGYGHSQNFPGLLGGDDRQDIVQASLIADTSAIEPDKPFRLGVLLKIKPGWHIYWKNPGESGFATTVDWVLPDPDMKAGETQYPVPMVFESPGPVTSYGYEDEVLLVTMVTMPRSQAGEYALRAQAKWLMCSDRCIPGKAGLSLKLPSGRALPANQEIFTRYAALVPAEPSSVPDVVTSASKAGNVLSAAVTVSPAGALLAGEDKLPRLRRVFFFPEKINGFDIDVPQVSAPDAKGKIASGEIAAFRKPVLISLKLRAIDPRTTTTPDVTGVLVRQTISSGGEPSNPLIHRIRIAAAPAGGPQ
jgi:DsbC/DsbD-like thiol-disulfide interchange protein